MAECFAAGPLETQVLGAVGEALALKMCYAAYSKGSTVLLAATLATAEALDVRAALQAQWARDDAGMPDQVTRRIQGSTPKAWRFVGEMEEIAATFAAAGLPGEFHAAAANVYSRLAQTREVFRSFGLLPPPQICNRFVDSFASCGRIGSGPLSRRCLWCWKWHWT